MFMTNDEIRREYRNAADPQKQIRILADQNACNESVIRDILAETGELQSQPNKRPCKSWGPNKTAELIQLILQKKTAPEMAQHFKTTTRGIYTKARSLGLRVEGSRNSVGLTINMGTDAAARWKSVADDFMAAADRIAANEPRGMLMLGAACSRYGAEIKRSARDDT